MVQRVERFGWWSCHTFLDNYNSGKQYTLRVQLTTFRHIFELNKQM